MSEYLTLNKIKGYSVKINGEKASVAITYRLPSALEFEESISKTTKNSELFSKFVTEIRCPEFPQLESCEKFLHASGTASIVHDICTAILKDSILSEEEKN